MPNNKPRPGVPLLEVTPIKSFETEPAKSEPTDVILHGATRIAIDSPQGQELVRDFVRYFEGTLSNAEIKTKWRLSDQGWSGLASNAPLLAAVKAEHERRVLSGECAREGAQRHFANAPSILNRILMDDQVAPRHRIEAARELRQVAAGGPEVEPGPKEKFTITINLGSATEVYEKFIDPRGPRLPDEEDPS